MARLDSNPKAHPYEPPQVSELDSEPQTATTEYKRHPVYSPSEWLLESISSIVALGLLIGIAVIFWYMDNKPLSAWRPSVSLNATISILTTACTTALMHGVSTFIGQSKWLHFKSGPRRLADFETFDGASRGIWGSILLLTTVKWNIATIGAFITILRLAFSPFAQQVILIEQREIISSADTATFGYAHNYTRSEADMGLANARISNIRQDPDMQFSIIQGLYGVNTTESFKCPGECRWTGPYISLGFKSECRNVTRETLQAATCEGDGESGMQQCNMTTPGGIDLATRYYTTDLGTAYYMNSSSLMDKAASDRLPDTFPEISRFAIYRSTTDNNFAMQDINITDCSLSLTAYEYTGAKANGSDFSFATTREVDFGMKNPWTSGTDLAIRDFNRIHTNESTIGDIHIPALEIGYTTLAGLASYFESTSVSTEWVAGNFVNANTGFVAALSGDVDISNRFDRMAAAITESVRYGPNMQSAHGVIVQSEPFVFIRWGYFIVPIVTEGLAILFAILTIFSNRQSRSVPLWKSSTLAVLACQNEEGLGHLQTTGKDINEIRDEAKKAEARLQ